MVCKYNEKPNKHKFEAFIDVIEECRAKNGELFSRIALTALMIADEEIKDLKTRRPIEHQTQG